MSAPRADTFGLFNQEMTIGDSKMFHSVTKPILGAAAYEVWNFISNHYFALQTGNFYVGEFNAVTAILLMVSTFDHCFFVVAKKSGMWPEDEVYSGCSFFSYMSGAAFQRLKMRLFDWGRLELLKEHVGSDEDGRAAWVDLVRRLRNGFVHRMPVIEQSLYSDINSSATSGRSLLRNLCILSPTN